MVAARPPRRGTHRPPARQLHGGARTLHRALARRDPRLAGAPDPDLGPEGPSRPGRGPRGPARAAPRGRGPGAARARPLPADRSAAAGRRGARSCVGYGWISSALNTPAWSESQKPLTGSLPVTTEGPTAWMPSMSLVMMWSMWWSKSDSSPPSDSPSSLALRQQLI